MNRRSANFILLSLPFAFFSGCKQNDNNWGQVNDKRIPEDEVNNIQDTMLHYYNIGKIDEILTLYDDNCTYVSDSVFGGIETVKRTLQSLYEYHTRNELLPLTVDKEKRKTIALDNVAWVVSYILTP